MPEVSVIVPVYRTERYLKKCLDSVVGQTCKDIEIICVYNDYEAEGRGALEILADYQDLPGFKIVRIDKPVGLSQARNEGLDIALGEYISFVDSDDYLEADCLELALDAIKSTGADMAHFYAQVEVDAGFQLDRYTAEEAKEFHRIKRRGVCDVDSDILLTTPETAWNKLYKKSIIDKYGLRFPKGLIHEDTDFSYRYMAVCGPICFIDRYLYHYVQRAGSIMSLIGSRPKTTDRVTVSKNLYNFYREMGVHHKFAKFLDFKIYWHICADYFNTMSKNRFEVLKYATEQLSGWDMEIFSNAKEFMKNIAAGEYHKIAEFKEKSYLTKLKERVKQGVKYTPLYRIAKKIRDILKYNLCRKK